jgi:hypothetical protein
MPDWFRRATTRLDVPRIGTREPRVAARVELVELTPATDAFLGQAAYLQLAFVESLARCAGAAPTTQAKEVLARVAALAIAKQRALSDLIAERGGDPAELMDPYVPTIDRFQQLIRGTDWYEDLVSNLVAAGFLDEFLVQVGKGLDGDVAGRVARILSQPTGEADLLALVSAGIDTNPRLASRLAMWGRRLVGDTMLLARSILVMDADDEANVEPVFTELIAAHTRRMDALGLTA